MRFDPERFTEDAKAQRPKFAYFPFGGGARYCIGEGFAWMEGVLMLATVLQQTTLRLPDPNATELPITPKFTIRPKDEVELVVEPTPACPLRPSCLQFSQEVAYGD
jgi:cytochrome P450